MYLLLLCINVFIYNCIEQYIRMRARIWFPGICLSRSSFREQGFTTRDVQVFVASDSCDKHRGVRPKCGQPSHRETDGSAVLTSSTVRPVSADCGQCRLRSVQTVVSADWGQCRLRSVQTAVRADCSQCTRLYQPAG